MIKSQENFKTVTFGKELRIVARRNPKGEVEMFLTRKVKSLADIDLMFADEEEDKELQAEQDLTNEGND
jgi:hypothetical protein